MLASVRRLVGEQSLATGNRAARALPSEERNLSTLGFLSRRAEAILFVGIMLVAALARLVALDTIPVDLHGDEAVAGIEARRILDSGSIGPYSLLARGVPAGDFYWTAAVFRLLGDDAFTLRLSFALLGLAAVAATFFAARAAFGPAVALIATFLLATSAWHVHYSRVAFIPIGWPLFQMLAIAFFVLAWKRRSVPYAAAAGASLGAGVYTYQAYIAFLAAFGLTTVLVLLAFGGNLKNSAIILCVTFGVAFIVALPMIRYANDHGNVFFGRYKEYSVLRSPEYKALDGPVEKIRYLADRETDYVRSLISRPVPDSVDAAGVMPLVDRMTAVLFLIGAGVALWQTWRARRPEYAGLFLLTVLIGLSPVLANEGAYRRTLGLTPLIATVAALPLALVWQEGQKRTWKHAVAAAAVLCVLVVMVATWNLYRYFTTYDDNPTVTRTYGNDFARAFRYVANSPADAYVYLYNANVPYNHPSREFFMPQFAGEDRSAEFGRNGFNLEADPSRNTVFLLMNKYLTQIDEVRRRYPGGTEHSGYDSQGNLIFISYFVSAARG
jgi:Dolichyl-phosphate-mannose-protein mannosyltransferase